MCSAPSCVTRNAGYRGKAKGQAQWHPSHHIQDGAFAGMLDHIRVEAYDEKMPLHTLATVLARDAQLLVASVYDPAVRCFCVVVQRTLPLVALHAMQKIPKQ